MIVKKIQLNLKQKTLVKRWLNIYSYSFNHRFISTSLSIALPKILLQKINSHSRSMSKM